MVSRQPVVVSRTVPRAENPRGIWLAPIDRVFHDTKEKYGGDPFGPPQPFSIPLQPGIDWRSATDGDKASMEDWYKFYGAFHAENEVESLAASESVVSPNEPSALKDFGDAHNILPSFVIALSLHTRVPLAAQLLRFEIKETPEGKLLPDSGNWAIQTVRLPGWQEAASLSLATMQAIAATYSNVKDIRDNNPEDNGMARSIGAYRAATSVHTFIDAIPILACASLEALTATFNKDRVTARVIPRYAPEKERPRLKRLYQLRQWFAHGADIKAMRKPEVRLRTLDEGLAVVKSVLQAALADSDLTTAAAKGTGAVQAFLDTKPGVS